MVRSASVVIACESIAVPHASFFNALESPRTRRPQLDSGGNPSPFGLAPHRARIGLLALTRLA